MAGLVNPQEQAGRKRKRQAIEQAIAKADYEESDDELENFNGNVFKPQFDFRSR